MTIRARLTGLFTLLVGSILLLFSLSIYLFSAHFRKIDFYDRLRDKALMTARVWDDADDMARTDLSLPTNERVTIYSPTDQLIFSVGTGYSPTITPTLLRQIRAGGERQWANEQAETIGVAHLSRAGQRLVIIASAYDRYGFNKLRRLRDILFFGWLASLLVVGVAGWRFASDALRPVAGIAEQVNAISGSNIHQRLRVSRQRDELAELARMVNNMLSRLEEAFVSQRSFVLHASHELRTPLTIIRGNLDVALMQPRDTAYYEQTLTDVLDEVKKMTGLANGLLDLARASSDAVSASFKPVRLDEQLWQARANLLHNHPDYTVAIDFDTLSEQDDDLTIPGDEALLRTAFQNLMENGCKYSPGNSVSVRISFASQAVTLTFADQGYGIPADDLPHLFEPFYRSSHTTGKAPGHGIGLALTHRIVTLHNGQLTVDSEQGRGTTVTISFGQIG